LSVLFDSVFTSTKQSTVYSRT